LKLFPLRAAILKLGRDKRLHIIGTFILLWIFRQRQDLIVPGCTRTGGKANSLPVGARPAAIAQHDNGIHYPVGGCASSGSHGLCGPKISENFCGIFALLCYISALLTNRN
jgi:hypothetical protein